MKSASKFTPRPPRREKTTLSSSSESSDKPQKIHDPVLVFCRIRPLSEEIESSCIKLVSPTILNLVAPPDARIPRKDVQYVFQHIFSSYASQKEIFDHIAMPLLEDLVEGKNGLLFTYGVTGSGKTYTLTGEPENPGIMPRCIDSIFNSIEQVQSPKFVIRSDRMNGFEVQTEDDALHERLLDVKSTKNKGIRKAFSDPKIFSNEGTRLTNINENSLYAVFISYTEIYNNTVFDLLDESVGKVLQGKILREDANRNMYVNGVVEVECKSAKEAYELFHAGQRRKRMAHTALNAESSRSHSIFNIRVVQLEQVTHNERGEPMIPDRNMLKVGQLSLVDLAGSERSNRTNNTGVRLKEASCINNSLMSLRNCLEILRENQLTGSNKLVPYRDTRLTHLFKNYFEGEGKVQMIVCINPSGKDYEENTQVMKFAEMSQEVKITRPESRYTPYRKVQKTPQVARTPLSVRKEANGETTTPAIFGPKIPIIKLNLEDSDESIGSATRLIKILKMRRDKARAYNDEVSQKERNFRKRLLEMNQENIVTRAEIRSIKMLFKKEKQKSQNLETKIVDLETVNGSLAMKNDELQDVIRGLHNKNNEKDLKINQNLLEKEKNKQKLALHAERMKQELDEKLRHQREHLNAAMLAKEKKLRKVREILDNEVDVNMVTVSTPMEVETQTILKHEMSPEESRKSGGSKYPGTPSKRHRRSRSVGEMWLEHNAVKPVALGTVLQPSMRRRKSVTKLAKASDVTNPKQSKYCLIAQEQDTDGELETKLYKGDIVPTCGGGAQVIFNDVERLRQESP